MFSLRPALPCVVALVVSARSLFAAEESPYLPIKEGTEWTMDAKLVNPKGAEIPVVAHRVIENGVERDGKKYCRERSWLEMKGDKVAGYNKLVRKDDTGFYSILEDEAGATEQREVVLPLKIGQSWEFLSKGETVKCEVIGLETVMIGAKTYENCFHLRTTRSDGASTEDFWESPEAGNVKSEIVFANGGKLLLTLAEFKSGK